MTDSAGRSHSLAMEPALRMAQSPRLAAGAPVAFDEAYDATFELAWRTLRRLGVSSAHLDDAAQDVFVVVHRRLSDFEGRSSLRTWVAGIAVRVASEYRRHARPHVDVDELDSELVDPAPGPLDQYSRAQAQALVRQLLRSLGAEQREVFVLTELEGMSVPEVAEAVGIKLNTAYSRLRLARQAFNAALRAQLSLEGSR